MSLAILSIHKPILLMCTTFESIVNHIKMIIPEMSLIESELIINKAFRYDIAGMLHTQEIEFQILYDEFLGIQNYLLTNSAENQQQQQQKKNISTAPAPSLPSQNGRDSSSLTPNGDSHTHDYLANGAGLDGDEPSYDVIKNEKSLLEAENAKLKKQMRELTNKVKFLQLQVSNQDELCCKLQHDNNQLKCKVDTLEIERSVLLKNIFTKK